MNSILPQKQIKERECHKGVDSQQTGESYDHIEQETSKDRSVDNVVNFYERSSENSQLQNEELGSAVSEELETSNDFNLQPKNSVADKDFRTTETLLLNEDQQQKILFYKCNESIDPKDAVLEPKIKKSLFSPLQDSNYTPPNSELCCNLDLFCHNEISLQTHIQSYPSFEQQFGNDSVVLEECSQGSPLHPQNTAYFKNVSFADMNLRTAQHMGECSKSFDTRREPQTDGSMKLQKCIENSYGSLARDEPQKTLFYSYDKFFGAPSTARLKARSNERSPCYLSPCISSLPGFNHGAPHSVSLSVSSSPQFFTKVNNFRFSCNLQHQCS